MGRNSKSSHAFYFASLWIFFLYFLVGVTSRLSLSSVQNIIPPSLSHSSSLSSALYSVKYRRKYGSLSSRTLATTKPTISPSLSLVRNTGRSNSNSNNTNNTNNNSNNSNSSNNSGKSSLRKDIINDAVRMSVISGRSYSFGDLNRDSMGFQTMVKEKGGEKRKGEKQKVLEKEEELHGSHRRKRKHAHDTLETLEQIRKKKRNRKTQNNFATAIAATVAAIPGVIGGKFIAPSLTTLRHFGRLVSFRFPVALAVYFMLTTGAKVVKVFLEANGIYSGGPLKDEHLDLEDENYRKYGTILVEEGNILVELLQERKKEIMHHLGSNHFPGGGGGGESLSTTTTTTSATTNLDDKTLPDDSLSSSYSLPNEKSVTQKSWWLNWQTEEKSVNEVPNDKGKGFKPSNDEVLKSQVDYDTGLVVLDAMGILEKSLLSCAPNSRRDSYVNNLVDVMLESTMANYPSSDVQQELSKLHGSSRKSDYSHIGKFKNEESSSYGGSLGKNQNRKSINDASTSTVNQHGHVTSNGILSNMPLAVLITSSRYMYLTRLVDATLRVTRDALLTSARKVEATRNYWRSKYRPYSGKGVTLGTAKESLWGGLGFGQSKQALNGTLQKRYQKIYHSKAAKILPYLDSLLDAHAKMIGMVENVLLTRPDFPALITLATKNLQNLNSDISNKNKGFLHRGGKRIDKSESEKYITDTNPAIEQEFRSLNLWIHRSMKIAQQCLELPNYDGRTTNQLSNNFPDSKASYEKYASSTSVQQEDTSSLEALKFSLDTEDVMQWASFTTSTALSFREIIARSMEERHLARPKAPQLMRLVARVGVYLSIIRVVNLCINRKEEIETYTKLTWDTTKEFVDYRFTQPAKAIVDDLLLNKRQRLTDVDAIEDAKDSLKRMLSDFITDTNPKMDKMEKQRLVENMDMAPVSATYDKEIRSAVRNIFSGKIVRMLLIQAQFFKKELLVASDALDDLFNANRVNLQLFAVFPACFLLFFFYRGIFFLFASIFSRRLNSVTTVHSNLRAIVRDIERLLILQSMVPTASSGMSTNDQLYKGLTTERTARKVDIKTFEDNREFTRNIRMDETNKALVEEDADMILGPLPSLHTSATLPILDTYSLGKLVLLIAKLKALIRTNSPRLERGMAKAMDDDLRDLLHQDRLSIRQQLMTVARIKQAYGFLQVRSTGPLFDLLK